MAFGGDRSHAFTGNTYLSGERHIHTFHSSGYGYPVYECHTGGINRDVLCK